MLTLSSAGESLFQLLFALFVFVGVLAITAFVTRWIAGYQKAQGLNRNLEVIEAIRLANNKYIQIIRAGEDKYFVIAVGKDEITKLGELSSFQLKEIEVADSLMQPQMDFKSILEKLSKKEQK